MLTIRFHDIFAKFSKFFLKKNNSGFLLLKYSKKTEICNIFEIL
ncbi:hypothetical protein HMPREF0542_11828 [Ligilactobacillus ruminis ATCC 25644]|uniref:Uncharacterized protein n=1 Tax=Ligilactobacillus ruminis ATCC 25644 TaxID=525362 RepID=E7FSF1_9LACO|nr:hypothetical protein HMPREF0542_11828 [Ligilactobacillus ruminis ATCC 25644]